MHRLFPAAVLAAFLSELLMTRPINAAALAIADSAEGCMLTAYRDPAGVPTAGYGHTGPDVQIGQTYTQQQALEWRNADMAHAADFVASHVTVELNDNQFSALAEFTYNIGVGAFRSSTLLRLLNRGDYGAVPVQLARWVRAGGRIMPGLVARRAREALLFVSPDTPVIDPPPVMCMPVKPQLPTWRERLAAWWHA